MTDQEEWDRFVFQVMQLTFSCYGDLLEEVEMDENEIMEIVDDPQEQEKPATLDDLADLLEDIRTINLNVLTEYRQTARPLTMQEQVAGSVFVGLLTSYFTSNGFLSCSAKQRHDIATEAWLAAVDFGHAGEEVAAFFKANPQATLADWCVRAVQRSGTSTLSNAVPQSDYFDLANPGDMA